MTQIDHSEVERLRRRHNHVGDSLEFRGRQADMEISAQRSRNLCRKEFAQALAGDTPDHFADQVAVG